MQRRYARTRRPLVEHRFGASRIRLHRLDNGLQLIVWEDRSAPVAAFYTWFGVGSGHEVPGRSGMAHLFEHLMFKETRNLKAGEFDRTLEINGVSTNAATWLDWTYYQEHLPSDRLELVARLEADRMENMILNQEQLDTERDVVRNERLLRVDNSPEGRISEEIFHLHFGRHPYGHPTIGWMEDISAITLDDCIGFHRVYYAPGNATITVVGDVDHDSTVELIRHFYGAIPASDPAPVRRAAPPPRRRAQRIRVLKLPLATPKVSILYSAPSIVEPAAARVSLIGEILFNAENARVRRLLVEDEELAVNVSGWYGALRLSGILELQLDLVPGASWKRAMELMDREIDAFLDSGPTERELTQARNRVELMFLQSNQSVGSRARNLGHFHTTSGDFRDFFRSREQILACTSDELMSAARAVLQRGRRTVVAAVPASDEE
ncbi:MAG: insulinase family protein [Deltaproteobacteria bacterium]|nr:insulinase family protein [Deltaproteobacteria bacterium]